MKTIKIHDKEFVPFLENDEIQKAVKNLALKVYEEYKNETPVFIGVLNGVFMFFADFLKYYPGNCEVAFIQMSSYHGGLQSTGVVYKKMDITKDVEGKHIILMEDIVDTGNTIESLFEYFKNTQKPKSLKVASAFLKPELFKNFTIDYVAKEIPNKFVIGYGLDYNELGRNLPDLYQLSE